MKKTKKDTRKISTSSEWNVIEMSSSSPVQFLTPVPRYLIPTGSIKIGQPIKQMVLKNYRFKVATTLFDIRCEKFLLVFLLIFDLMPMKLL